MKRLQYAVCLRFRVKIDSTGVYVSPDAPLSMRISEFLNPKNMIRRKNNMAVRTTEEILESIKTRVGDSTEDADLEFLEDVTDTLSDLRSRSEDQEDWKTKYEENDKQWREKYRDRFFEKKDLDRDPDPDHDPEPEPPKTFEDLFK